MASFYLSGYKITWAQYYWIPQVLNPGGYIEDPVQNGGLPALFWSTTEKPDGVNIFSQTQVHNKNMFPLVTGAPPLNTIPFGLSWLRQADTIHLNRTWWRLTRSWIGGPMGHWDKEIYTATPVDYQTSELSGSI